ncbi:MAG: hypothetical protein MUE99_10080 [Chitinophagaceae bacterium]|jgi:hypothetical protein|nr:hypothetical protein [Chitinophagaceae bacterium]
MDFQTKRLSAIMLIAALILSIPFFAIQFTNEVNWSLFDFAIAGILLFGTGLTIELVLRKVKKMKYRIMVSLGILIILFIVWAELAVGIFGSPFAGS